MLPATILIVEDNPVTRKMVRVTLMTEHYSVVEAPDGRTAISSMMRKMANLILQDLLLPDLDGFELAERLRALPGGSDVPILAFSGLLSKLDEARALQSTFNGFLFKPVEPSRLLEVVREYLPAESPGPGDQKPGHRMRLLAADDDPIQRKLAVSHLQQLGFQVDCARNGAEALEQALRSPPDAILSDVLMPGLDGFKLCQIVRRTQRLAHVPVVLYSSHYVTEADHRLATDVGANALINRSSDFEEVAQALLAAAAAPPPPPKAFEYNQEEYSQRIIQQLERQVAMNEGLAHRCSLQTAQLSVLGKISEALVRAQNPDELLEEILARYLDAAGASLGVAYRMERDGRLSAHACIGFQSSIHGLLDDGFGHPDLLRRLIEQGAPSILPSSPSPVEGERELLAKVGAKSLLCTPLTFSDECQGLLIIASTQGSLDEDALHCAKAIGLQIAQAVALSRTLVKLTESEQKFRQMAENIQDVFWMSDPATTEMLYVSPAYEEIWGRTCASLYAEPRSFLDNIHPDDRERAHEVLTQRKACGRFEVEYRIVQPSG